MPGAQFGHKAGPASLMRRAYTSSCVSMEVPAQPATSKTSKEVTLY